LPYAAWHVFYELGLQSSAEEIFFRGVVFNYLYNWQDEGFWRAAAISSALNVSLYLPKTQWTASPEVVVGVFFYVFIAGMIYAGLYRWFRSLLPSYVCNVTVSLISAFRGPG
jgi:membrane protease YdiL (CAAX protease family)